MDIFHLTIFPKCTLFQKRRMKYKTMPFSGCFSKVILCDLGLGSVLGLYR